MKKQVLAAAATIARPAARVQGQVNLTDNALAGSPFSTPWKDESTPDFVNARFIWCDHASYGASPERKRLIGRWAKEVNSLPS